MSLSNDQIFDHAISALKAMLAAHGPEYKFPSDVIWQYMPASVNVGVDVPSTSRPHQPARLMKAGYLEKTGGMTRAQSSQRAGSSTAEYRFGPKLVPSITATPAGSAVSSSERLKGIRVAMDAEGYMISAAELANFYLAMIVSPLVILSGISGTGKSLLPRKFAKLTSSGFNSIPVQPQWTDNSDLFGYVPTLAPTKYIDGALTKSLLEAKASPSKLVIALLDEMNLAPVEHYFSDFLSVAETRSRVGGHIETDSLPIELPPIAIGTEDPYADLRDTQLPGNLRIVGTANMDESTHTFSPKVLDRAFTIELDDPVLTDFASATSKSTEPDITAFSVLAAQMIQQTNAITIQEARAESQPLFEHIAGMLAEIQEILAPAGIKFGYRTRDAILLYLHFWRKHELADIMSGYAALDFCILQKILPKVAGSGEALAEALEAFVAWLTAHETPQVGDPFPEFAGKLDRSIRKAERMAALLDLDGATRFWGA
ncbi:McrB family protein [Pseudomonas sp. BNK-6]|uniref:McrB family protein n=1 Tax=unclassified Pseudomonas TaxID=196821 RepID=UPI003A866CB0